MTTESPSQPMILKEHLASVDGGTIVQGSLVRVAKAGHPYFGQVGITQGYTSAWWAVDFGPREQLGVTQ